MELLAKLFVDVSAKLLKGEPWVLLQPVHQDGEVLTSELVLVPCHIGGRSGRWQRLMVW